MLTHSHQFVFLCIAQWATAAAKPATPTRTAAAVTQQAPASKQPTQPKPTKPSKPAEESLFWDSDEDETEPAHPPARDDRSRSQHPQPKESATTKKKGKSMYFEPL